MRHFDIANRDRDRVTIIGSVTPAGFLTTSLTFAAGKDDYLESLFGLRDNTHRVYGAGVDYAAERQSQCWRCRIRTSDTTRCRDRARPIRASQFTDPSRNWAADSTDRTHSVLVNADVARIANKVDLRLSYDFSRARARYDYITGPVAGSDAARGSAVCRRRCRRRPNCRRRSANFSRGTVDRDVLADQARLRSACRTGTTSIA